MKPVRVFDRVRIEGPLGESTEENEKKKGLDRGKKGTSNPRMLSRGLDKTSGGLLTKKVFCAATRKLPLINAPRERQANASQTPA